MDFAALMSAQIAKTSGKQPPSSKTPAAAAAPETTKSKYLKRSEIEQARQAAYLAEQAAAEAERQAKAAKKRQREEEEAEREAEREAKRTRLAEESKRRREEEERQAEESRRRRVGLPPLPTKDTDTDTDADTDATALPPGHASLSPADLTARLRALHEPATLFGETHAQRLRRHAALVAPRKPAPAKPTPDNPIPTTLAPVPEAEMRVSATIPAAEDVAARTQLARQLTSWFTLVLAAWSRALAGRADKTKETTAGRAAGASMAQAVAHLAPLYRRLERGELADDVLAAVAEIVAEAQARRYVAANDAYLRLSIGKAAWPIGVTMVGIHERSAREKLHESDKANIMADETTRKMLQGIKRCLTFAQTRWPPEDVGQLMG